MNIKILGAHSCETQSARLTSLLVDDVLAIDAGGLASSLSIPALRKIKAILLTHQHYDHVNDIPNIARSLFFYKNTINIYSIQAVYDALTTYLMNGKIADEFFRTPEENPIIGFTVIEPNVIEQIGGYSILAVPVNHSVPTVGYQITSPDGKIVFYTGDTGPGLADCWQHVAPHLLIIDTSFSNRHGEFARKLSHLTPNLLKQELDNFQKLKGYLPQVVTIHTNPDVEEEIKAEIAAISKTLNHKVTVGYEDMEVNL